MAMPGPEVAEISLWQEEGELWRGLRRRFLDGMASHRKEQDIGEDSSYAGSITTSMWQAAMQRNIHVIM